MAEKDQVNAKMKKVTVAVVCYNEESNITALLTSLMGQSFEPQPEILVIDNGSTDGTQDRVRQLAHQFSNIRLLVNPVRGIAGSRNLALQQAGNDLLAFIDADCEAPRHWLSALVGGYEKHHRKDAKIVAVGGSNEPPGNTSRFYDALRIFLNTYLGSRGSVQGMRFPEDRKVDHLPTVNILFNKQAVLDIGGFDTSLGNIGEDQDLSHRLIRAGYQYYYLANASVTHKLRATAGAWFKNMILYGKGRMWLIRKHPDMLNTIFLLPVALVLGITATPLLFWQPIFAVPLLYFPIIGAISLFECVRNRRMHLFFDLVKLYILTHFGYGLGEILALLKRQWTAS